MKYPISIVCCFFLSIPVIAWRQSIPATARSWSARSASLQSRNVRAVSRPKDSTRPAASLSALPPMTIRFRPPHGSLIAGPKGLFSHFEVVDERPDTARIGVHTSKATFGRPHDHQLVFDRPAALEIADYLNRHFARPGAPYTALVVLRTLWLSDASYIREDILRDPDRRFEKTHIRLKAEVYAVRGNRYLPVLRFDTLQATKKMRYYSSLQAPYSDWDANLAVLFGRLADSCSLVAIQKKDQGHWIGPEAIRQFNATRFDAPIGDNTAPARGVYANFEEFRNNTPSVRDFEIKMENKQRLLYIRESGKTYYSHDAWGYSNGKEIYIMRDGVLCPAWKEGKAFYFYSDIRGQGDPADEYYRPTPDAVVSVNPGGIGPDAGSMPPAAGAMPGGVIAGSILSAGHNTDFRQRYIYSVDMDTGDIY